MILKKLNRINIVFFLTLSSLVKSYVPLMIGFFVNRCHRLFSDNETFEINKKNNHSKSICQKSIRQAALER